MSEDGNDTSQPVDDTATGPTDIADPLMRLEARKAFVWLGMAALLALAIFLSQSLLVIFGGIVFAAMIDGGARLLGRVLDIKRGWRIAIVLLLTLLFFVWVVLFAGTQIASEAAALPNIVQTQFGRVMGWLNAQGFDVGSQNLQSIAQQTLGGIGQLTSAVGGLLGGMTTAVLILVLGIYFSIEPSLYRRGVAWLLPAGRRDHFRETAEQMAHSLRRLLAGRLLGMAVEGFATWALLAIYGVPMAALLGLLTGLLAFLPNIGAIVSGILMVLVGFSGGWEMGLYAFGVYAFVQIFDGYVVIPLIARKTVDLAPALVLAAQLVMGVLFGILGLLLADPLVAMLKVWLERRSEVNQEEEAEGLQT